MREVFENIFDPFRNDLVHIENYEDKWIALREVVDNVFCDLQRLSIKAQNQSLSKWFKEVIKSMEAVQVSRNILYISDSPFFLDASSIITSSVREDLNTSWLTQVKVKPAILILKKLKQDPEQDKRVKKLEQELFDQKMLTEALKRQMAKMKEEYKAREEALEETVKKQSEDLKAIMMDMMAMMAMMKQQQQH